MADDVSASPQTSGGPLFRFFNDTVRLWAASVVSFVSGGSAGAWTLQQVSPTTPLPVGPGKGPIADISGTLTVAATDQVIDAANPARNGMFVLNPPTATEIAYINFGASAGNGSGPAPGALPLPPGVGHDCRIGGFLSTDAIHFWAVTAGHPFIAKKG